MCKGGDDWEFSREARITVLFLVEIRVALRCCQLLCLVDIQPNTHPRQNMPLMRENSPPILTSNRLCTFNVP